MKVLVMGAAGFIGSALSIRLLECGDEVVGIDNHNYYYNPQLKEDGLARNIGYKNYTPIRGDLADCELIEDLFETYKPNSVVNLAAQAGVYYSLENLLAYVDFNFVVFAHILEGCRHNNVGHLVSASSSSVYGANTKMPFSTHDNVNHPVSLYAATKIANELMAHSYSHLYKIPTTGLRFFTVYGSWDRPDMALQEFVQAIKNDRTIQLYSNGNHRRNFTYIDDIVEGVIRILDEPAELNSNWAGDNPDSATSFVPWRVYNIGNNNPVGLKDYIAVLEKSLGKEAKEELLPLQPGDVEGTFADVDDLIRDFDYKPSTLLGDGMMRFND